MLQGTLNICKYIYLNTWHVIDDNNILAALTINSYVLVWTYLG